MKWVLLSIFLVSLAVLRPYQLESGNLIYAGIGSDDFSYLSHATALTLGAFPSYQDEKFVDSRMPMHSIGPGLLAAPFVYLFSRIDILQASQAIRNRNGEIQATWAAFGFSFASVFYFCVSCMLLFHLLRRASSEATAAWATVLVFVVQGFPLFAYRRPVFSHIYELFAQTLVIYCLLILSEISGKSSTRRVAALGLFGGFVSSLVALVRYNNIFMALAWPLIGWWRGKKGGRDWRRQSFALFAAFALSFGFMILLFKIIPTYLAGGERYKLAMVAHFELLSVRYIAYRFLKLLVGWDWGLLWTAPFTLLGLAGLLFSKRHTALKLLLLPVGVNLALTLLFASQGGWYGYRYLIFTLSPLCAFGLADLLDRVRSKNLHFRCAILLLAIPPLFSMLCFEGNPTNLTLHEIPQDGRVDWGNATYQLEIWKTCIFHPAEFLQVIAKGVPAYAAMMFFSIFGKLQVLPGALLEKYPAGLQSLTLVRTALLLLLPFATGFFYFLLQGRRRKGQA